jgi:oxygen-independent coproporphyrinogen-3 oxidase
MDHFAKPDDELAVAQRNNKLYRNFQGYSTHSDCDLIGLGVTSIGSVGDAYTQNVKTLDDYQQCINRGELPVYRGVTLSQDDKLRRDIITQLICHFELDIHQIEHDYAISFADYFADELAELQQFVADQLLEIESSKITVFPAGHLLIRNICMAFDAYLHAKQHAFSKVI